VEKKIRIEACFPNKKCVYACASMYDCCLSRFW